MNGTARKIPARVQRMASEVIAAAELLAQAIPERRDAANALAAQARDAAQRVDIQQLTSVLRKLEGILPVRQGMAGLGQIDDELLEATRAGNRANMGLAALPDFSGLVNKTISRVTVRSDWLPPGGVSYVPGANGQPTQVEGSGIGAKIVNAGHFEFELQTPVGMVRLAPGGRPAPEDEGGRWFWPAVAVVSAGALGISYVLLQGILAILRGRK